MKLKMEYTCYIITVSDKGAEGKREDITGEEIARFLKKYGFRIIGKEIVPDDAHKIKNAILNGADLRGCNIVITNGGTGLSPRDLTPDVTKQLLDYEIPGIPEVIRIKGYEKTHRAVLSRGVCGVRGKTIVLNLPGSPGGAIESLEVVIDILEHAIEKLLGSEEECGRQI